MFLVMNSSNSKIGNVACTYLPIKNTCPNSCPLKETVCYARTGYVGMHVIRLEKQFEGIHGYNIIRREAREIAAAGNKANGKALRLHVSGDVRSEKMAEMLSKAAKKWDGKVYGYTHSWRDIKRKYFGGISILASVETIDEAKVALRKGYVPALTVLKHPENGKAYMNNEVKIIPCPSQTRGITCEACKLCMNDKILKKNNAAIAFAVHGNRKSKVSLTVIR